MKVSVIIPCHNQAQHLAEQLDALAVQQFGGEWDVIVVDHRSTDGTSDIALAHAGLRGRLRVERLDDGHGVARARRAGVEASDAEAFLFCDGDDVVAPGWLDGLASAMNLVPLATGQVDTQRLNPPALAMSRGRGRNGVAPTFASHPFVSGGNCAIRRDAWELLGGFDEQFPGLEDIEFSLRAVKAGVPIRFVPEAVLHYRYRSEAKVLWRQATFYGASGPLLARRCIELGLTPPPRRAGLRSWAWLVVYLPVAWVPRYRPRWWWTLGSRIGSLRSALGTRLFPM